jgi:hypothetical protein
VRSRFSQIPNVEGLGGRISGLLDGKSQVVRPLESDRYCKELDTLSLWAIPAVSARNCW